MLLDVQMPVFDGFEVIEELDPGEIPVVVFVTAFDQYALRAFAVHAIDYLLTPIEPERFGDVLRHVREILAGRRGRENSHGSPRSAAGRAARPTSCSAAGSRCP